MGKTEFIMGYGAEAYVLRSGSVELLAGRNRDLEKRLALFTEKRVVGIGDL